MSETNSVVFCGVANKDLKVNEKSRTVSLWNEDDAVAMLVMGTKKRPTAMSVLEKASPKEGKLYRVEGKLAGFKAGEERVKYILPTKVTEIKE